MSPPTDDDLEACDRLADGRDCGRCEDLPEEHFDEITAKEAAKLPPLFGQPRQPREAYTVPARSGCYCHHPGQCPVYEAMQARWPAQAALKAAYDHVSDLLPEQLRELVEAPWVDREAVLAVLPGKETKVEPSPAEEVKAESSARRAGPAVAPRQWWEKKENDGSWHFGDGVDRGKITARAKGLQRLMRSLLDAGPHGVKWDEQRAVEWSEVEDGQPYRINTESLLREAGRLRQRFPKSMQWRLESDSIGARLDTSDR